MTTALDDSFSLVRRWIGEKRESFCPPSSYTAASRASYTVIHASPHNVDLLGAGDVFHRVLICEETELKSKDERLSVTPAHVLVHFDDAYATQTPGACIYWDVRGLQLTDSLDDYHVGSTTLSQSVYRLISHPQHPVPMMVICVSSSFPVLKLTRTARHEAHMMVNDRHYLILAGACGTTLLSGDECRHQIATILQHPQQHLRQRLRQIMDAQLWRCPNAQRMLWERLMQLHRQTTPNLDDEDIYNALRECYHSKLLCTPEAAHLRSSNQRGGEDDGRANSRVREIMDMIAREGVPVSSILDVGCGEGSITTAVGKALNLRASRIHGCDVREPASTNGFTFQHITDNHYRIPYEDEQFPCVLALMSLHHIDHVEDTLTEIRRILRPGGVLIIREHDLSSPELSPVIDVMHGLYARVWSDPPEQPTFCDTYYAHYRPRAEWTRLIEGAGLIRSVHSPDAQRQAWDGGRINQERNGFIRNPFQHLYGVYRRPKEN